MNEVEEALAIDPSPPPEKRLKYSIEEIRRDIMGEQEPAASKHPTLESLGVVPASQLLDRYTSLRPPTVDCIAREGEIINIVAGSKTYKSMAVLDLAVSCVCGGLWLGKFGVHQGNVLMIDNELHQETFTDRLRKVIERKDVPHHYLERLQVKTLRGELRDIFQLEPILSAIQPGQFKIIILDALYRFLPSDSENDNGAIAGIYNLLDRYALATNATIVNVHHTSKGNQAEKEITDVGSGASSQSRAADGHLVLRQHEQEGCAVLQGVLRSWPPLPALGLRMNYPCWSPDPFIDPTKLKRIGKQAGRHSNEQAAEEHPDDFLTPERFVEIFITTDPKSKTAIEDEAIGYQVGRRRLSGREVSRLLRLAHTKRLVFGTSRNRQTYYQLPTPGGK